MYIKVKAVPGAKEEYVERVSDDTFRIYVKEPPERNLANGRIREIVARELGVSTGKARMISGHRSLSKIFSVDLGAE